MNFTYCNTSFLLNLPNRDWNYTFGGCMAFVSFLSTLENGILFITFVKFPSIRIHASNKILFSMVVSDWLNGAVVGPLYSVQAMQDEFNCIAALPRVFLATVFTGTSLTTVGLISIDRAHHLIKLQKYSIRDCTLYRLLALCWIIPILIPASGLLNYIAAAILSFLGGILIFAIMIISYISLIVALGKHTNTTIHSTIRDSFVRKQRAAAKTSMLILTVHACMVLPVIIERVIFATHPPYRKHSDRPIHLLFIMLLMVGNSAVNPLIYCARIPTIRTHLMKLFRGRRIKKDDTCSSRVRHTRVSIRNNKRVLQIAPRE